MGEVTLWYKIPALFVIVGAIGGLLNWLGIPIPENVVPSVIVLVIVLLMVIWLDDRIYKIENKNKEGKK